MGSNWPRASRNCSFPLPCVIKMAETAQNEVLSKFNESTVMDQVESFLANSQTQTN